MQLLSCFLSQNISQRAGDLHWLSWACGPLLPGLGELYITSKKTELLWTAFGCWPLTFGHCACLDGGAANLWEILSQQTSFWEPLETVLRLRLLSGLNTYSTNIQNTILLILFTHCPLYKVLINLLVLSQNNRWTWSKKWPWIFPQTGP